MPKASKPKTAKKTAKPSPRNGNRLPLGNHPGNTGGKKGRSGRKPLAFKQFASSLAQDPTFQDSLKRAAQAGDVSAIKLVIQYAEGLPPQKVEHSGSVTLEAIIAKSRT